MSDTDWECWTFIPIPGSFRPVVITHRLLWPVHLQQREWFPQELCCPGKPSYSTKDLQQAALAFLPLLSTEILTIAWAVSLACWGSTVPDTLRKMHICACCTSRSQLITFGVQQCSGNPETSSKCFWLLQASKTSNTVWGCDPGSWDTFLTDSEGTGCKFGQLLMVFYNLHCKNLLPHILSKCSFVWFSVSLHILQECLCPGWVITWAQIISKSSFDIQHHTLFLFRDSVHSITQFKSQSAKYLTFYTLLKCIMLNKRW